MNSARADRWLVFDGRNDLWPAIKAIRPDDQIQLLNPLDSRTSAWSIASDATSLQQESELVATFLPDDPHIDPILLESSRALLGATIHALNVQASGKWGLAHLIAAAEPQNIAAVLSAHPVTQAACRSRSALSACSAWCRA
jgi:hypothetical protein